MNDEINKNVDILEDLDIDFYHITLMKLADDFKHCIQKTYKTDTQ